MDPFAGAGGSSARVSGAVAADRYGGSRVDGVGAGAAAARTTAGPANAKALELMHFPYWPAPRRSWSGSRQAQRGFVTDDPRRANTAVTEFAAPTGNVDHGHLIVTDAALPPLAEAPPAAPTPAR